MSNAEGAPVYHDLIIVAASPATEIWLGDDRGHLVQKEIGTLETSLLPGDYTVEFGLQREHPVVFLHDPWFGYFGRRDVLCLWTNAGRRELGLEGIDDRWSPRYRFAFVRYSP